MSTVNTRHRINATGHAMRRAQERYSVRITPADYRDLCTQCFSGRARLVGIQETGVEVRTVLLYRRRLVMLVAYSRELKRILTFLPFDAQVHVMHATKKEIG